MSEGDRAEVLLRLVHDVGKYGARTARSLAALPALCAAPPPDVVAMLARDLYDLPGGGRASDRLRALAGPLLEEPALQAIAGLLDEVDRLEPEVRAGAATAVGRAVACAIEVDDQLRALLRAARGRAPGA